MAARNSEQVNTKFVSQVEAMEARSEAVGVGGVLSYVWPSAFFENSTMYSNASEAHRAERLG